MTGHDTIRTAIHDAILDGVSAGLDGEAVRGVEWAGLSDTVAAIRNPEPRLAYWDEYNRACEVV